MHKLTVEVVRGVTVNNSSHEGNSVGGTINIISYYISTIVDLVSLQKFGEEDDFKEIKKVRGGGK